MKVLENRDPLPLCVYCFIGWSGGITNDLWRFSSVSETWEYYLATNAIPKINAVIWFYTAPNYLFLYGTLSYSSSFFFFVDFQLGGASNYGEEAVSDLYVIGALSFSGVFSYITQSQMSLTYPNSKFAHLFLQASLTL